MRLPRQIYYCGISGALAGLFAWLIIGWTRAAYWQNLWLSCAFVGAGTGGLIAIALAFTRGLVEHWSYCRLGPTAFASLGCGALVGAVGLLVGQALFLTVGGEWLGRIFGWVMLSLLIGLGYSLRNVSARRCLVSGVGGLVAGLFSGLIYEGLTQLFLTYSSTAQIWASSIGFMTVGGLLATGIPLAETLVARGVLIVLSGQRKGSEYVILDHLLLGCSESCRVLIPDDPEIEPEQILLQVDAKGIRITNVGRSCAITVNGVSLPPGETTLCQSGGIIRVGRTNLRLL
ncbi:MAG: hypothetical protein KatS3mg106_603 [Gemmataceae bacterium]|jgi:hypothetical protein|nr:MAG: hypothetical protein KatS3mg106_603 [Gemmataceae bacterium]